MSIYFKCLRGDSQHLALVEPDSFAVRDLRGRDWLCYPIPPRKVENLTLMAHVTDVFETDDAARKQGLHVAGTEVRIVCCEAEDELPLRLVEEQAPPV